MLVHLKQNISIITNGISLILRGYFEGNSRINIVESDIKKLEKYHWEIIKKLFPFKILKFYTYIKNPIQ